MLCQERYRIFLARACRGVRGYRVGGHIDRAYMLLGMCKPDLVVARLFRLPLCLFYLPPRQTSTMESLRENERKKEKERQRCDVRRVGGTHFVRPLRCVGESNFNSLDAFDDPDRSRNSHRKRMRATTINNYGSKYV